MDRIVITDIVARGKIGVTEHERERPQDILVNLNLEIRDCPAFQTDRLQDTLDYSDIVKNILYLVENSNRKTLEALAEDIAAQCLRNDKVASIKVRVEKPNRVRFTRLIGVEIERRG